MQAEAYLELSQFNLAKQVADEGLVRSKQLTTPRIVIAELLFSRGFAIESLGDLAAASEEYISGLEIAESLNDKNIIAQGLTNLGAIYYLTEKFDRALIVFNEALSIASPLDDDELKGYINAELGILYNLIEQPEKSMIFYQKSYEYFKIAGNIPYAYNSLSNIAVNHAANERYEEAIPLYKEILDNSNRITNVELIASIYIGMAWAQLNKKDKDEEAAYQYMLIANQYVEQSEQYHMVVSHAIGRGYIFLKMKRYQEAMESADLAIKYQNEYKQNKDNIAHTQSTLDTLNLKAEILFETKQYKQAYEFQDEYLTYGLAIRERMNVGEVEDLRMRYESEQADLAKKILEQKQSLQSLALKDVAKQSESRQLLTMIIAVVAIVLAWILIKIILGQKQLLAMSNTDSLTGVVNRRRLMQLGIKQLFSAVKRGKQYSLLILDIDNFKKINDRFGHKVGDDVLQEIAMLCQNTIAEKCVFGRLGGEEFITLFPDVSNEQAKLIAESVRAAIANHDWAFATNYSVTASIGVASYEHNKTQHFADLIKQADNLLYEAKHQGKNRVCY